MTAASSANAVHRHFIDWNDPIAQRVAHELIPEISLLAVDLNHLLIVLPTAQAGRRLRNALIQRAPIIGLNCVTPNQLLQIPAEMHNVAIHSQCLAVWLKLLKEINYRDYNQVFPRVSGTPDVAWRMQSAKTLHNLRKQLVDSGKRISYVLNGLSEDFHEYERWKQLAKLEQRYIEELIKLKLFDPYAQMIKQGDEPVLPEYIKKIIVAAVPDPNPIAIRALESLSAKVPVELWIHAPECIAEYFDEWGRPNSEAWNNHSTILHAVESYDETLLSEEQISLVNDPTGQAKAVSQFIAEKAASYGPADFAIGMPDTDVIPAIQMELAHANLSVHDPAGHDLKRHPVALLIKCWLNLLAEDSYSNVAALIRHPDMRIERALIAKFDTLQNKHLPLELQDLWNFGDEEIKTLVNEIQAELKALKKDVLGQLRAILKQCYATLTLNPDVPKESFFIQVAQEIQVALSETESLGVTLDPEEQISILNQLIDSANYYSPRNGNDIDLEGWLELHWNDAPALVLTGMNENLVPDSQPADIFLPESMRETLDLRSDKQRYLRDSYLMLAMIMCRQPGDVHFISAKTNSRKDALKPSRLLFHCNDKQLAARAKRLFDDVEKKDAKPDPCPTLSYQIPQIAWNKDSIPVTAFRDYLSCPFRFYLKRVLRMEHTDDRALEMDQLDFGNFVHNSIDHCFKEIPALLEANDLDELKDALQQQANSWIKRKYGKKLPLHLEIQKEAGLQRLSAFAQIHIRHLNEGWKVIDNEVKLSAVISGLTLVGRIDRVEQHEDGRIRLIDIKTSDSVKKPKEVHLQLFNEEKHASHQDVLHQGKAHAWLDLQLPLYDLLYRENFSDAAKIELGFIVLPKAMSDAGYYLFEGYAEEHLPSSRICAETIIQQIQANRFWPPAARVTYDDFEELMIEHIDDSDFRAWADAEVST